MTILGLLAAEAIPSIVAKVMDQCLVPLFILYNIVGWAGLPAREADRTQPPLSENERSRLGQSIWAAWWLGALAGAATLTAVSKICIPFLCCGSWSSSELIIVCISGAMLGVFRGLIGRVDFFRNKNRLTRRRVLASLLVCAVAVSFTCAALYYDFPPVHGLIASAYTGLFAGYAATYVFEVGK